MVVDSKFRWGELEEDEEGDFLNLFLPPPMVTGPDENGIKKRIEYKLNEDGQKVKVTTTTRTRKLAKARLSKNAVERRSWAKFGDAIHEDVGARLTMVSNEEILLERPRAPVSKRVFAKFTTVTNPIDIRYRDLQSPIPSTVLPRKSNPGPRFATVACAKDLTEVKSGKGSVFRVLAGRSVVVAFEEGVGTRDLGIEVGELIGSKAEESTGDGLSTIGKGAVLMVCRTCGKKGDHWTSRCPYKDLAQPPEFFEDKPPATPSDTAAASVPVKGGAYVPPNKKAGSSSSGGQEMRRRNDENSVRVTNLSEDTREPDLHELFRTFGTVTRVYVAVDQKTGMSRGFGFVNFLNKEDAERAINKLNGYGYDNLILRVEWATPRAN
ncbi:hypothetical protein GIB67_035939 [Kingdonia uniflora]|uniref:Eukaryotic translation initiation factor 3 subunit G n=1 Tax=Kingdonia uniflora TaxID=39325 RepID=A0A7J7N1D2_9MAGN|nr:hypothetical protein GIB67_035939 [Kingdonia uniflora]